jgi:hypothetical protein
VAVRRCTGRLLVALMLHVCLAGFPRSCSRIVLVVSVSPEWEVDAAVASLTGSGVASATAWFVPGRRGWGALMRQPTVTDGDCLAWSEVAAT